MLLDEVSETLNFINTLKSWLNKEVSMLKWTRKRKEIYLIYLKICHNAWKRTVYFESIVYVNEKNSQHNWILF